MCIRDSYRFPRSPRRHPVGRARPRSGGGPAERQLRPRLVRGRPGPAHRLEPGAVGPVADARCVVGCAAVRARRAARRPGHPRQARPQRRTVGDHDRGLSDLRHRRLVQDPGLTLAGRHRGLLPDAPGLLLPLAGAVRAAGQQRGDRHADHLRDGDRAGRLPVHALQPPAQECAAGRDDLRAPLDRVPARAAVLLARDGRR